MASLRPPPGGGRVPTPVVPTASGRHRPSTDEPAPAGWTPAGWTPDQDDEQWDVEHRHDEQWAVEHRHDEQWDVEHREDEHREDEHRGEVEAAEPLPLNDDRPFADLFPSVLGQEHPGQEHPEQADPGPNPNGPARVRRIRSRRWGRATRRWVPEPLRDSRVDPGRRGALLLTVVAALAALAAAIGVWRERPEPRPVQSVSLARVTDVGTVTPPTPTPRPATGGRSTGTFTGPPTGDSSFTISRATGPGPSEIVVYVAGAVSRPGLVTLPAGSRVADAIAKAGGATARANLGGLNLAEKLTDGASVTVASGEGVDSTVTGGAASTAASAHSAPSGPVNLNTADAAALDALPGVGPVTAANIVAWRDKNGRFTKIEQLQEIPGIGPARFATLAPLVTI